MKRPILKSILALLCLTGSVALSAQCPAGNIFLDSQSAINNFGQLYPNCEEPSGDVYISGSDVWSLLPIANITHISGSLELNNMGFINSLNDLNVVTIGDEFRITDNLLISHFQGMEELVSIGGDFFVFNNPSLNTLNGMTALESVTNVRLLFNQGLVDISQLQELNEINGFVHLIGMTGLDELTGLQGVPEINGDLKIEQCGIEDFSGLEGLTTVNGNISITGNDSLVDFSGLSNLTSVQGEFVIENNQSLESIHHLSSLTDITDSLIIAGNEVLSDCDANAVCYHITNASDIVVQDNAAGCNTVDEIEMDCAITSITENESSLFELYPNPSSESVTVRHAQTLPCRILDMSGRQVMDAQTNAQINVSTLSPGMYLVELSAQKLLQYQRLLIK